MLEFAHFTDNRGNRLIRGSLAVGRRDLSVRYLCVEGCDDIVGQIDKCMARIGGTRHDPARLRLRDGSTWPHVFRFPTEHVPAVRQLRDLLTNVLTLRSVPEMDVALALDFHTRPRDDGDFERTEAGELMWRTKYCTSPTVQRQAGSRLCDLLADVIRQHPLYNAAGVIVAVPSTKSRMSELIAESVANRVDKPWVKAVETTGSAWENKAGTMGVTPKQYRAPDDVFGDTVIVIDDLYRSGQSMRGVAAAVRAKQAFSVYGLAATRTLRGR